MKYKISQHFGVLFLLIFSLFACIASGGHKGENSRNVSPNFLKHACNTTLYPEVCVSTLRPHQYYEASLKSGSHVLKDMAIVSVKVSLEEVNQLTVAASSLESVMLSSDHDEMKRVHAIKECEMLFKYTVRQLNESLILLSNKSGEWKKEQADDVQTWLSASITDHVTCIQGFKEVEDEYAESVRNVSKVVSNSLAIVNSLPVGIGNSPGKNKRRLLAHEDGDFPRWMSSSDQRRLLKTAGGVRANAVVAKDGTGNYRSISEAINAAPSLSNGRYVVHVKAGVYQETVKVYKDNIMLVGDGKYATIVTGSNHGSIQSLATFGTLLVFLAISLHLFFWIPHALLVNVTSLFLIYYNIL